MRKSTLLLLLAAAACGEAEAGEYLLIENFLARSSQLACERLPSSDYIAVTGLRTASDSTVLVLDGPGRRILELNAGLRRVWEIRAPSEGPGALSAPISAALLGDTAVAVAERMGLQLIVYARSGALIRSVPLGFAPSAVAARPSGDLLVTVMPFGGSPGTLLFRYDGSTFRELPVRPRGYADMMVGALGNTTLAEVLPDGTVLLVHQFLSPRAFRVGADDLIEPLRVPTPDATRDRIDFIPRMPLLEDQIESMLVPASAMSVDPTRSEVYLLTRSGRRVDGRPERAILRLDRRFGLLESYTVNVMARHLAVLPRDGILLVADDEDRFHACELPRPMRSHARAP